MNKVPDTMARPSKNDERGDIVHICTYRHDNCDKLSLIVFNKTRVLVVLMHYAMFMFITANNKAIFVHVIYLPGLNNLLYNMSEELIKVIAKQHWVLRYLSLSLDMCDKLHCNFSLSVQESSYP